MRRNNQKIISKFNWKFSVEYWNFCTQPWPPERESNSMNNYRRNLFLFMCWYLIDLAITFLNWSRLPQMIPKHSVTTGSCTLFITIGSNRCTLIGNKYQFNRSNSSLSLPNVFVNCWPISQVKHANPTGHHPKKMDFQSKAESIGSRVYEVRHAWGETK